MKKILAVALALVMLITLVPLAFAADGYTLEFWIAGNDDSLYAAYDKVVKQYEAENPGVTINMNMINWSEYFAKLSTSFVGGTGPDVYATGFAQFYTLSGSGNMLNLAAYIPEDWDGYGDIPDNILNLGKVDGDIHALLVPEARALYYRKDIAQEQGVTEDDLTIENLDDLIALAKKMTIKDGDEVQVEGLDVVTLAANSPEQTAFIYGQMEGATKFWDDDLSPLFNTEPYVSAATKIQSLLDEGYAIPQSQGITYFNTDVAAMYVSNETVVEGSALPAITDIGGEVGIIKLPNTVLLGQWYAANADTTMPQESADFLLYLFSKESQQILIDSTGQIPSRASLADQYCAGNDMRKVYFDVVQNATAYGDVPNQYFLSWINQYRSAIESIRAGTSDAQTALDGFCDTYREICGLN